MTTTKKQHILALHGGGSYALLDQGNFLESLETFTISLDRIRCGVGWKSALQDDLGEHFEVFSPRMPFPDRPHYEEWKVIFEKTLNLLEDNLIVIGHSLGGLFLMKYLSENIPSKKVKALVSVAAPFAIEAKGFDFTLSDDLSRIEQNIESVYLFHSKDDPVVSIDALQSYKEKIPNAHLLALDGYKHINGRDFPELLALLRKI